jgi:hypothetical protein
MVDAERIHLFHPRAGGGPDSGGQLPARKPANRRAYRPAAAIEKAIEQTDRAGEVVARLREISLPAG